MGRLDRVNMNKLVIHGGICELIDARLVYLKPLADALLLATEWNEFREPDFDRMKSLMRRALIFDGRNIYNPKTVAAMGFEYVGVGRR